MAPPDYKIPELDLSEVTFVELLQELEDEHSKYSKLENPRNCVVRARWLEKDCVVKVFHHIPREDAHTPDHEPDPFTNETRAYSRLKARGFCERGDIPDVYGVIKQINPRSEGWEKILYNFFEDDTRPSAIVIEYIPNSGIINLPNFSYAALKKLRHILAEMHEAWVEHSDPYPRNMLLQEGTGRALWIDFDVARTYTPGMVTERQRSWFVGELNVMDQFIEALVSTESLSFIMQN
ncbi:uncharacterized protein N7498_006482 [Penicillium cinerascens]|uniref:Protein kinase domain-containing protein n=1 Tax=Penicillium cinerascens TaxID=70096 RepID=A0A9W9MIC0_9EURO|nr:uncharacterized protein N7498_006482 [Penicillium cinerascens]KAJ5201819.1 hypothetical protein N7498_006482 [Penicillium cinerascens]